MTGMCCAGEGPRRRLARRFCAAVVSLLPGTALALLPKCPLCIAAWITVVTGIGVPAVLAVRMRGFIALFWFLLLLVIAAARRRAKHGPVFAR